MPHQAHLATRIRGRQIGRLRTPFQGGAGRPPSRRPQAHHDWPWRRRWSVPDLGMDSPLRPGAKRSPAGQPLLTVCRPQLTLSGNPPTRILAPTGAIHLVPDQLALYLRPASPPPREAGLALRLSTSASEKSPLGSSGAGVVASVGSAIRFGRGTGRSDLRAHVTHEPERIRDY